MELAELKNKIINSFNGSKSDLADILAMIDKDKAIFPFNEYEHLICALIDKGNMTYDQYLEIRAEYISENPNLWIFEISAPRGFGEKFAQTYIKGRQKEKTIEMRISQKSMTQLIAPGNMRFKIGARGFNRLPIGAGYDGRAARVLSHVPARPAPEQEAAMDKGIRRLLNGCEKLFAGRIQALMNLANQHSRPDKLSGF